jgi:hypothetical protein
MLLLLCFVVFIHILQHSLSENNSKSITRLQAKLIVILRTH